MIKTAPFRMNLILAGIIAGILLNVNVTAQDRSNESIRVSPNAAVTQTIGTTEVTITYGRPSVRDRVIFGDLVPFDRAWRTGANEATTITFSKDVLIEGESLEAGMYGLFTIPKENGVWTIIFNNVASQWGVNNYDSDEDALRVDVTINEAPQVEQMIFYFENVAESSGEVVLRWEGVRMAFRIDEG